MPTTLISDAEIKRGPTHLVVIRFPFDPLIRVVADVLTAVDRLDIAASALVRYMELWRDPTSELEAKVLPSQFLALQYRRVVSGAVGPRLRKASFASPGSISLDVSGPFEKIIDILHSGRLQKDQLAAVTQRLAAETELLVAQAAREKVAAATQYVALLKSIGFTQSEIREVLVRDPDLMTILAPPLETIGGAVGSGQVTEFVLDTPAEDAAP